jgi:maleamate amidohydrolase
VARSAQRRSAKPERNNTTRIDAARPWNGLLTEGDRRLLKGAGFARRVGFGSMPAILVIDAQNYMLGDKPEPLEKSAKRFPSSTGERGWRALRAITRLLDVGRSRNIPVFFTRFVLRADGEDVGVYGRKRKFFGNSQNWCIDGTYGAELSPLVAVAPGDLVLVKNRFSAFWGTPLLGLLIQRKIDTLIVVGGSTSNCVRATVFDAASYNFRTAVVQECVFDRFEISQRVSLFEMDRQFADVVRLESAIRYLRRLPYAGSK